MDEYKKYYYKAVPLAKNVAFGSIEARLKLRENLQCKSFKWYLDNVYPDLKIPDGSVQPSVILTQRNALIPGKEVTFGSVRQGSQCLDTLGHLTGGTVGLYTCHGTGGNQEWSLTKTGNIKHADLCLTASSAEEGETLKLKICDNSENQVRDDASLLLKALLTLFMQRWRASKDGKIKLANFPSLCLDSGSPGEIALIVAYCGTADRSQKWFFSSN